MPGVRRNYKVPVPDNMDSHVLLVPYRGQAVPRTNKMAPKQTRAAAKTKELQSAKTPLMNIKNAKVQETWWAKTWAKIKEWAYVDKKPTPVVEKINHSTIMNYMNTPFMASFGGTKETTVKFIISQYHNRKFYFDRLVEISDEVIYKPTGLSNQGDPVPVGIK